MQIPTRWSVHLPSQLSQLKAKAGPENVDSPVQTTRGAARDTQPVKLTSPGFDTPASSPHICGRRAWKFPHIDTGRTTSPTELGANPLFTTANINTQIIPSHIREKCSCTLPRNVYCTCICAMQFFFWRKAHQSRLTDLDAVGTGTLAEWPRTALDLENKR